MLSLHTVQVTYNIVDEKVISDKSKKEDRREPLKIMILNKPLAVCYSSPDHSVQMSSYA